MSDCVATMRLNCAARACIHRIAASVRSSRSVWRSMAAPSPRSRRFGRARRRGMPEILPIGPSMAQRLSGTGECQPDSSSREQSNERGPCSLINAIAIDEITISFANRVFHPSEDGSRRVSAAFLRDGYARGAPRPFQVHRRRFARLCSFAPRSPPEALTLVDDASARARDDNDVRRVPRVPIAEGCPGLHLQEFDVVFLLFPMSTRVEYPHADRDRQTACSPMTTSYPLDRATYIYDVNIRRAAQPPNAGCFYAKAVNIVRVESGQTVSVNAGLHNEYGATPDEAFSKIERAVEAWAQRQTRPN